MNFPTWTETSNRGKEPCRCSTAIACGYVAEAPEKEIEAVAEWLRERIVEGLSPAETGIFVRSEAELRAPGRLLQRRDPV